MVLWVAQAKILAHNLYLSPPYWPTTGEGWITNSENANEIEGQKIALKLFKVIFKRGSIVTTASDPYVFWAFVFNL